jgi:ketosteroid isomerase-like protein
LLRTFVRALSLTALVFCPMLAGAQSTPEAAVRQYLAAFNAGDMDKVASFNSPSGMSIVDEFAPYNWSGAQGFSGWSAAFDANAKAHGITDPNLTLGPVVVNNTTASGAYLIFSSVYAYKEKGVTVREPGRMAIVMRKEGGAWKVAAWTWAGTVPKPSAK